MIYPMKSFRKHLPQGQPQTSSAAPVEQQKFNEGSQQDRKEFYKELEKLSGQHWSALVLVFMCVPSLCYIMLYTTFAKVTKFEARCKIPALENNTWTFKEIKSLTSPENNICYYYRYNYNDVSTMKYAEAAAFLQSLDYPGLAKCDEYVYDTNGRFSLYVKFNLVCDNLLAEEFLSISPDYGKLFGSMLLVPLADLIGRKRLISWSVWIFLAGGLLLCLAESVELLMIARVVVAMAYVSAIRSVEAIAVETSTVRTRAFRLIVVHIGIPIGFCLIPLFEETILHWRLLQWNVSWFILLMPLATWYIPESPRWYLSKGNMTKARSMLGAFYNQVAQSKLLEQELNEKRDYIDEIHRHADDMKPFLSVPMWFYTGFFTLVGAAYFKNYVVHFPMNLAVSRPVYFIISGIMEVAGYGICLVLLLVLSRKVTMMFFFITSGIFYIVASKLTEDSSEMIYVLAIIELATSAVYASSLLFVMESVPTSHRCSIAGVSVGLGTGFANIFMFHLRAYFIQNYMLFIIVGCICFVGAGTSFFALEIKRKKMNDIYDTVSEVIPRHAG